MDALEFCPLTKGALGELLSARHPSSVGDKKTERRQMPRWPFPGTVELWVPDESGIEQHVLATSINLSLQGVGIKIDDDLPLDTNVGIAIHEPEVSLHGRAFVRHCTPIDDGYYIGLSFAFNEA